MIAIVRIGSSEFAMSSIVDATKVIALLSKAELVEMTYSRGGARSVELYFPDADTHNYRRGISMKTIRPTQMLSKKPGEGEEVEEPTSVPRRQLPARVQPRLISQGGAQ